MEELLKIIFNGGDQRFILFALQVSQGITAEIRLCFTPCSPAMPQKECISFEIGLGLLLSRTKLQ